MATNMKFSSSWRQLLGVVLVVWCSACTMEKQEAPSLSGPSEFGKSINVTVTPDIITQDGASQSVVTVTARGPNGEPLANVSLRAEIRVGGVAADFGRLSAQSLVTDSNGRATVVYTAPASPAGQMVFEEASRTVAISVTPVGTDFLNSTAQIATLRLLPPPGGIVVPTPQGFTATFQVSPNAPTDNQLVQFDASGSSPPAGGSISRYQWEFGDGGTGIGVAVSHVYTSPGQYTVTLVVEDNLGRTRSAARSVTVVAGTTNPTAVFNFSPTTPVSCRDVFFNASQSTASSGRQIVAYRWVFGDGTTSDAGPTVTKRYTNATTTTYNVTLTVTDNLGSSTTSAATQIVVAGSAVPCS
jgi:chitodextrinase